MWDCNCGLLSASNGISRLSESLLYLVSVCTFWWTCYLMTSLAGPTVLAEAHTAYLLIPEGKVAIQAPRSKNCRLSFSSPDETANLGASGVSAARTPAHTA